MTDKILLHPGDRFPALTLALTGGGTLRLPDDLAGHFSVILCYRGSWCPCCNAQLRAFQRSLDRFADVGIVVAALSVDDEATTKNLIAKHGLQFPIDHSSRVIVSVYSSGAIGRLVPGDVIGLVRYLREHAPTSQPPPTAPTPQR